MKTGDLNLLAVFDAIMREGSVTRAADRLAMTQPAVSNAMARMRLAWNDPLFVKNGRGVVPTPQAVALWERVRPHLQGLREAVTPEPFDAKASRRGFRIAAADVIVEMLWRPLRRRVERDAPGIDFYAVPYTKLGADGLLMNGEVDAVIGPTMRDTPAQIHHTPLLCSYFACAMRKDHPLAGRPLSLEAYAAAEHLLVSLSGDPRGMVDDLLEQQGLRRRVSVTVNHFAAVPSLLRESDLICTVPFVVVAECSAVNDLFITRPPLDLSTKPLSLLWHERSERDPGHRWLREQIAGVTEEVKRAHPTPACLCPGQMNAIDLLARERSGAQVAVDELMELAPG